MLPVLITEHQIQQHFKEPYAPKYGAVIFYLALFAHLKQWYMSRRWLVVKRVI